MRLRRSSHPPLLTAPASHPQAPAENPPAESLCSTGEWDHPYRHLSFRPKPESREFGQREYGTSHKWEKHMAHDQDQNIGFLCVSYRLGPFLGFEKVKAIFCDIPSDQFKRIAYAARLDDTERATLKNALTNYPEAESVIDSFFCNALVWEIGCDPRIKSRSKRVLRELNSFKACRLHVQLEKAHVAGIDEWLKEIEHYYENDSQFPDFYIEGLYALTLRKSGMTVQMKPYRDGGPDLQVSIGCLSFDLEVTRFIRDTCLENELDMSSDDDDDPLLVPMPNKSSSVCSTINGNIQQ